MIATIAISILMIFGVIAIVAAVTKSVVSTSNNSILVDMGFKASDLALIDKHQLKQLEQAYLIAKRIRDPEKRQRALDLVREQVFRVLDLKKKTHDDKLYCEVKKLVENLGSE